MKVFLNDKLVDADEAYVSVNDMGFLYGAGLFETMRAHNGAVFAMEDHLERLFISAKHLSIVHGFTKEHVGDAIEQTLKANDLSDARMRLTLTAGTVSDEGDAKATLLVTATEFEPYPAEYYKKGVMVVISAFKQNPAEPTTGHKTTNYFSRLKALSLAHQKKAAEAIWFTTDNVLAEGCVSNIFLVKDSKLYTPTLATPVLGGIARKTVCKIAAEEDIEVVETDLFIADLLAAEEVFITNMVMQILPVNSVEAHTVADGKVGKMTKRLSEKFNELIEKNCK